MTGIFINNRMKNPTVWAIIIRHMVGNMPSHWTNFLTEDGEKGMAQNPGYWVWHHTGNKKNYWSDGKGWDCFLGALDSLKRKTLGKSPSARKNWLWSMPSTGNWPTTCIISGDIYIAKIIKTKTEKPFIPKGQSQTHNNSAEIKDPAKKY